MQRFEFEVADDLPRSECSGCGAEIAWYRTKAGKALPLSIASIRVDEVGRKVAIAHFADCPQASLFRRKVAR